LRAAATGSFDSDLAVPRYNARSLAVHSHSRLERNSNAFGNVSVLSVVSIWKTLMPASRSTRPIRHVEWWISLWRWSMKLRLASMVFGL
jgi:hypothetical protein